MDGMSCSLVVPAAGESTRFAEMTSRPKGLIKFDWRDANATMLEHSSQAHRTHYLDRIITCRYEDVADFDRTLRARFTIAPIARSIGQANSVLHAMPYVHPSIDLIVVNSDNGFEFPLMNFVQECRARFVPAGAIVFDGQRSAAYGYVDSAPMFQRGAEKRAISRFAVAGAFYYRSRNVFEQAYYNMEVESVTMAGVSLTELYQYIHGEKYAYQIERDQLHTWGTAEELIKDPTVSNIKPEAEK